MPRLYRRQGKERFFGPQNGPQNDRRNGACGDLAALTAGRRWYPEDMRTYCVYMMASASGVLYIGVTNNLERRVSQHQQKLVAGFTARYNVRKLVYFELYGDARVAIAREKQIKGWLRRRKIALIECVNPSWKDLTLELARARGAASKGG
jgi:putative endonuclease